MNEEEAYKIFSEMTPDVLDYVFCLAKAYTKKDEEIKKLKEEYIMLQNASDEVEEEKDREIERLNNIINKAIEYIETKWEKNSYYEDIDNCMKFLEINEYDKADLLNILRGDKE